MKTPIRDFVKEYSSSGMIRAHMPGHKGRGFLGIEQYDITEVDGADVLYSESGVILESEKNAADCFGSALTLYSAEGSTLSIKAMMCLSVMYAKREGKKPLVFAQRNAHKAFMYAAALLDFDIEWLDDDKRGDLLSGAFDSCKLESALDSASVLPTAVYLTSPDYLGNVADIACAARICHERGVLLLVDNAHGAYLNFLQSSLHPIALGADACADSAHKTLPVLTGGGYLHISVTAPEFLRENARHAMATFASSSPSYLILQSLDMANEYISRGYRERLDRFVTLINGTKSRLREAGYRLVGDEPLKISLKTKQYGYEGSELSRILRENGIICEFCDPDHLVLMLSPENEEDLPYIEKVLLNVKRKDEIKSAPPAFCTPKRVMSPREAILSPSRTLPISEAVGEVLAGAAVSCPPCIPILVSGERIDRESLDVFRYYGVDSVKVVL